MVSMEMSHSPWEVGDLGENLESPMSHGGVSSLSRIRSGETTRGIWCCVAVIKNASSPVQGGVSWWGPSTLLCSEVPWESLAVNWQRAALPPSWAQGQRPLPSAFVMNVSGRSSETVEGHGRKERGKKIVQSCAVGLRHLIWLARAHFFSNLWARFSGAVVSLGQSTCF